MCVDFLRPGRRPVRGPGTDVFSFWGKLDKHSIGVDGWLLPFSSNLFRSLFEPYWTCLLTLLPLLRLGLFVEGVGRMVVCNFHIHTMSKYMYIYGGWPKAAPRGLDSKHDDVNQDGHEEGRHYGHDTYQDVDISGHSLCVRLCVCIQWHDICFINGNMPSCSGYSAECIKWKILMLVYKI